VAIHPSALGQMWNADCRAEVDLPYWMGEKWVLTHDAARVSILGLDNEMRITGVQTASAAPLFGRPCSCAGWASPESDSVDRAQQQAMQDTAGGSSDYVVGP